MRTLLATLVGALLPLVCFAQADAPKAEDPDTNVIATVLGQKIVASQKDKLSALILRPLLQHFATENKIEPTEEELDVFVLKSEERENLLRIRMLADRNKLVEELESPSLPDQEREKKESDLKTIETAMNATIEVMEQTKKMEAQMRPIKRQMALQFVKSWKINKALYEKYGGRVIFQQAGVEPLDAYRDFLKELEKKGSFQILDKQYEAGFWRYFTNDAMHTFSTKEDAAGLINTPWWMRQ